MKLFFGSLLALPVLIFAGALVCLNICFRRVRDILFTWIKSQ